MKHIKKLNIDFMRHRHIAVAISAVLVLFSLLEIFFLARLNMGIDFAGGTQLIVRFLQPTEIDEVRGVLAGAGLGEVQIQRYGEEGRNDPDQTPLVASSRSRLEVERRSRRAARATADPTSTRSAPPPSTTCSTPPIRTARSHRDLPPRALRATRASWPRGAIRAVRRLQAGWWKNSAKRGGARDGARHLLHRERRERQAHHRPSCTRGVLAVVLSRRHDGHIWWRWGSLPSAPRSPGARRHRHARRLRVARL
jgi:hypothetical protein